MTWLDSDRQSLVIIRIFSRGPRRREATVPWWVMLMAQVSQHGTPTL